MKLYPNASQDSCQLDWQVNESFVCDERAAPFLVDPCQLV